MEINKTEKLSLIQRSQGLKPMFNLHENSRQQLYTLKKFKFSEIQIGKKHKKPTIMHHTGNWLILKKFLKVLKKGKTLILENNDKH